MALATCEKWLLNPLINPVSNRKIKLNGPTYKKLEKQCKSLPKKSIKKS